MDKEQQQWEEWERRAKKVQESLLRTKPTNESILLMGSTLIIEMYSDLMEMVEMFKHTQHKMEQRRKERY